MAASRLVDDAGDAETVDRDEAADIGMIAEQPLHAAQIAKFLLADSADEQDVADGHDMILAHGLDERQHCREPARVVADARRAREALALLYRHIGAFGKHGVEVR